MLYEDGGNGTEDVDAGFLNASVPHWPALPRMALLWRDFNVSSPLSCGVAVRERLCCCWDGTSRAGTRMRGTCRQFGASRADGIKTRRSAVAESKAQLRPAMLKRQVEKLALRKGEGEAVVREVVERQKKISKFRELTPRILKYQGT